MRGERLLTADDWGEIEEHSDDGNVIGYECPLHSEGCRHHLPTEPEIVLQHLEHYHGVTPDGVSRTYSCFVCGVESDRRSEIVEHVRDEHPDRLGEAADDPDTWEPWGGL